MQEENNFYNNGWEKVRQKDYVGANADFLKAFKASKSGSVERLMAFFSRGCVEIYLGQYEKAVKIFSQVIKWHEENKTPQNQQYGEAFFNRGMAYVGLRKKDEAIKDFYTALDYGSGAASYGEKAWAALNKLGQFEEVESPPQEKPQPLPAAKAVAKSLPNAWKTQNSNVASKNGKKSQDTAVVTPKKK